MCALKECNKPCPWDPQAGKFWKFCTPAHKKEKDKHVACPAMISVHDPQMHAEQILAGTRAYVTPVVPLQSRDSEDMMKMADTADELAVTLFDEDALRTIDWSNPDDAEELGSQILVAAFDQVLVKEMTTTDEQNIDQSWRRGMISAEDVAEIYAGSQAQEIAWFYNSLDAAVRARCKWMMQEEASEIEVERIREQDEIKMGLDLATKIELNRIAEEDHIESQVYGVLCTMIEQIANQLAPAEEESQEVIIRVPTCAEQAWEALKAKRESRAKAAAAHAAMLKTHAENKARKLEAKRVQRVKELERAQEQLEQLARAGFVSTSEIMDFAVSTASDDDDGDGDDDDDNVAAAEVSKATKRKRFERWEKPKRRLYLFDYQVHAFRYGRMKRSVRRQFRQAHSQCRMGSELG